MSKLQELLTKEFGVRTRLVENPVITSIGTTAGLVLSNNPDRLAWVITNLSVNVMYVGYNNDVASTKGIYLDKNGGSIGAIWKQDFQATSWEVFIVAAGASSAVYSYEVVAIA